MKTTAVLIALVPWVASADPTPAKKGGYTGLGADSMSKADVAKFAPSSLEPALARKIQSMIDVRGTNGGVISSTGDRMFFTWNVTGTPQVWRQDGPQKFPVQLTGGDARTTIDSIAPDDSFLAISRDYGGEENPGLYLASPHGGPLTVVQHTPKVQTQLQFIADDSKSLVFRANDVEASSYALYRYDIAAKKRELVFGDKGIWRVADHLGTSWLLIKELGNTQQEVYRLDVATKALTPVIGQGEGEQYDARFGPKPGQILVHTPKLGEFSRVYSFEAGKLTPITPELAHDIDSFRIDQQRARIYYVVNEDGYKRLHVLDAKSLKELPVPAVPGADNVRVAAISRNGRYADLQADGATMIPTTVTLDWTTNKTTQWRPPMAPEIDVSRFAKQTLESFPARDGTKIPMFVRRPASCDGPCPVVVEFHGGPESQAAPGFSTRAQMWVDAGFVFVQPNVRGSDGYGKAWLHADDGPKRLSIITDIEDCSKFIRASWAKNGKAPKVGVIGGSYGGYSTLMAMTYFAGAYDAGVAMYSISDLRTFLLNTAPYRRALRVSEYGDPDKDKDALVKLSPITHVAKVKSPLLLIQGLNDPRTPVNEAVQIYKELKNRNVPGGLIVFADEGHGASKRDDTVLQQGHAMAFFAQHLK